MRAALLTLVGLLILLGAVLVQWVVLWGLSRGFDALATISPWLWGAGVVAVVAALMAYGWRNYHPNAP